MSFLSTDDVIAKVREVAKRHGWAIGVHGSLKRDIDLIAIPWTEEASLWVDVWLDLSDKGTGGLWRGGIGKKPHNRIGTIFLQPGAEPLPNHKDWDPPQIDVSFVACNQDDTPFNDAMKTFYPPDGIPPGQAKPT